MAAEGALEIGAESGIRYDTRSLYAKVLSFLARKITSYSFLVSKFKKKSVLQTAVLISYLLFMA